MYYLLLCEQGVWKKESAAASRQGAEKLQREYIQAMRYMARLRTRVASPSDILNFGELGWEDNAIVNE